MITKLAFICRTVLLPLPDFFLTEGFLARWTFTSCPYFLLMSHGLHFVLLMLLRLRMTPISCFCSPNPTSFSCSFSWFCHLHCPPSPDLITDLNIAFNSCSWHRLPVSALLTDLPFAAADTNKLWHTVGGSHYEGVSGGGVGRADEGGLLCPYSFHF